MPNTTTTAVATIDRNTFSPGLPVPPAPTVPQPQPQPVPAADPLTDADRLTLQRALRTLKTAREAAKSQDPKVSGPAKRAILMTTSYLCGFLTIKGLLRSQRASSGFDVIASFAPQPTADAALDDIIAMIEALLTPTRLTPLGAGIGTFLIIVGEYLLAE